ncbi:unnamed protein product, partial [Ectocarpus sp. 12 AP-2014]
MKKQITYPKFIPRIFAMVIDLTILSIVLAPLMNVISQNVMVFYFQDFFQANGIDTSSLESLSLATTTPEFAQYLTASKFLAYSGTLFIINTIFMGVYFVFFWRKFGATPGKIIMRMRFVNAEDYS